MVVIGVVWVIGGAVTAYTGVDQPQPPMLYVALGAAAIVAGILSYAVRARERQ